MTPVICPAERHCDPAWAPRIERHHARIKEAAAQLRQELAGGLAGWQSIAGQEAELILPKPSGVQRTA